MADPFSSWHFDVFCFDQKNVWRNPFYYDRFIIIFLRWVVNQVSSLGRIQNGLDR